MSHHSKSRSRRYEDYKNRLKITRKSEAQRNKRFQQLAEAQKLLEQNCISDSPQQASYEQTSPLRLRDDVSLTVKQREIRSSPREEKSPALGSHHWSKDTPSHDEGSRKRGGEISSSRIRKNKFLETHERTNGLDCSFTSQNSEQESREHNRKKQSKSTRKSRLSRNSTNVVVECPKLLQLRERMMLRKKRRREQLEEKNNENASHRKVSNEKTDRNLAKSFISMDKNEHERDREAVIDLEPEHSTRTTNTFNGKVDDKVIDSKTRKSTAHRDLEVDVMENSRRQKKDSDGANDDDSIVDIELIYCHNCERSYAPATYKKFCLAVDENGVPKCVAMRNKKRKVYNSAKIRITKNENLNSKEQKQVIESRKKVVQTLRDQARGKVKKKKSQKWREQSQEFREAMKSNRLITKAEKEGRPPTYYL